MITVKRSCNSSNRVEPDKIVFNSFIIDLTNVHAARFAMIHEYFFDDRFDRVEMARTLTEIIDIGMYQIAQEIKTSTIRKDEE